MKIALDYDDTYTKDPAFWDEFLELAYNYEHDVRIVTHRHPELDKIKGLSNAIIYTDGVAKKWFCEHRGDNWTPDIWIDDKPKGIFENGPLTEEEIRVWRNNR